MKTCSLFFISILSLISFASSLSPSYIFPNVYEYRAQGWVSDPFLDNHQSPLVAFGYVDYTTNNFRADELWNLTALSGTPFNLNTRVVDSDHHLQVGNTAVFYFNNHTGAYCFTQPAQMLLPQNIFTANTFQSKEYYCPDNNDYSRCQWVNVFNSSVPNGYATLYVDDIMNIPVVQMNSYQFGPALVQSFQYFTYFKDRSDIGFSPDQEKLLFTLPDYCPRSNDIQAEK